MTILGKYFETESLGYDQYQTTIGLKDVNYLDDGIWKRNVLDWIDSGIGERPHIVTTAPFIASVSPDGLRRIHPTREDDVWFEMSGAKINNAGTWEVVQLGTPTSRVDNRITWNRTNFNAYMDMAGHYVKLGYLLNNGYLPPNNQFAYEVAINGLTRQGGTLLKDGVPVMHMRVPVAYDYDNPEDVRQIAYEITRIDGKWHVVFTLPDLTGMSKPLIDPTLTLQPDAAAGNDTYLSASLVDNNYGIAGTALIDSVGVNARRGLLRFDVSPIPATATIDNSIPTLFTDRQTIDTIGLHRSIVEWFEGEKNDAPPGATDGSTWNHKNANTGGQTSWGAVGGLSGTDYAASSTATGTPAVDEAAEDYGDVKVDVQNFVDGTYTNYGWWIITEGEDLYRYDTSDHATAAQRPKLVTNYTEAGGGAGARILNMMPMRRKRRVM